MLRTPIIIVSLALLSLNVACSSGEPTSRVDEQAAAFADLRSAVRQTVTDDGREKEVLGIIDALEQDVDDLRALLVRRRAELRELNADYDATRENFVEFTSQMEARIQNGRREAIEQHIKLAEAMTDEEWASLSKAQTRAMRSTARSVQGI
jgi:hypothetical protein